MIEVKQDLDSLSYDTGIEIKIISENFDSTDSINRRIMKWQQAKSDDAQEFKTGG